MTKLKAVTLALKIINECQKHDNDGGSCRECPFSDESKHCIVSAGNDIPTNWNAIDKLREVLKGV